MKVKDTKKTIIQPIISQCVVMGSTIMSDEWQAYKGLSASYNHSAVKHREGQYVICNSHIYNINGFWSLLKCRILGIYHSVIVKHLN